MRLNTLPVNLPLGKVIIVKEEKKSIHNRMKKGNYEALNAYVTETDQETEFHNLGREQ